MAKICCDAVAVAPALVALNVYVLVVPGVTWVLVLHPTEPIPLSIEHVAALVVVQLNWITCAAVTCVDNDAKLVIAGPVTTVNVCAPLVPPAVVTVTLRAPVAAATSTVNVAVSEVPLVTLTLLTVTALPLTLTVVAPAWKFVPVRVMVCDPLCAPVLGERPVSVGADGLTVKLWVPLVPPDVVTLTVRAPRVAPEAIVKSAVIDVALTTAMLATVTPVPLTAIVAPETKFVPVSVTLGAVPVTPTAGLIPVSVGAGGRTVSVTAALTPPDVETIRL